MGGWFVLTVLDGPMRSLSSDLHLIPAAGDPAAKLEQIPTRDGFGQGLVALGTAHEDVVVLCGDLSESTRALAFQKAFPDRYVEVGVAEQNMTVLAAGLSMEGKVPFMTSYGVFVPGRCWDQVRISLCYNRANVKIGGAHTGISVGPDGATHQAMEDLALTRVLPGMTVLVPCDAPQTKRATEAAYEIQGPAYIRFAREKTPVFTTPETPFEIGKAQILCEGSDVTVVGCGPLVYEALRAAALLEGELSLEVINLHTVKPIDAQTLEASARKTGRVVTIEEHQITGGIGSAVAECLSERFPVPVKRIGMPDAFGESGTPAELPTKYGMTAEAIVAAARELRKRS